MFLDQHASSPITDSMIKMEYWDYVILQGSPTGIAYPDSFPEHPVYPALISLRDKIYDNCSTTRIIITMPWAFEDGMIWLEGWTDLYDDMQVKIYQNILTLAKSVGFAIAPVGWAWVSVLDEKDYPLHYLHMADWVHPTIQGSYLAACVIFSSIYQESSVGNAYLAGLEKDEADYFQEVATNTVLDDIKLWRLTKYTGYKTESIIPEGFRLDQNYPNPFHTSTVIAYQIQEAGYVRITIFDKSGKTCARLVDGHQSPGNYSIIFDAGSLPPGLYFYTLQTRSGSRTRKMVLIK